MRRRVALVVALVSLGLLLTIPSAYAHALLRTSDPADGAQLAKSPSAVVLSFTEDPDPSLSIVHVIDQNGNNVEKGKARPVPGHSDELTVEVGDLPNGVYTVSWRTVSRVDGHVTAGAFAFGVGVSPAGHKVTPPKTPSPSLLTVVSRWIFYTGLFLLLGVAFASLFVASDLARAPPLAHIGWFVAVVGLLGLVLPILVPQRLHLRHVDDLFRRVSDREHAYHVTVCDIGDAVVARRDERVVVDAVRVRETVLALHGDR